MQKETFGQIFAFAGQKRAGYIRSVIFAVIGAVFQILPFFVMARVTESCSAEIVISSDISRIALLWRCCGFCA